MYLWVMGVGIENEDCKGWGIGWTARDGVGNEDETTRGRVGVEWDCKG